VGFLGGGVLGVWAWGGGLVGSGGGGWGVRGGFFPFVGWGVGVGFGGVFWVFGFLVFWGGVFVLVWGVGVLLLGFCVCCCLVVLRPGWPRAPGES